MKRSHAAQGGVSEEIATGSELGRSETLPSEYLDSQALGITLNEGAGDGPEGKAW
jgi:hypothetical protein